MNYGNETSSTLLAAMADGIGDLTFASEEWVQATAQVLRIEVERRSSQLKDLGSFSICEVAHNAPAWMHVGNKLAWHAQFQNDSVTVSSGELPTEECDLKIEGDHSLMSNLACIQHSNRDPKVVLAAQARLLRVGNWTAHGDAPTHTGLARTLRSLHDIMAERTMPRFAWMSPEWVSLARHIVSTRATSEKYRDGLADVVFTFAEEFVNPPKYAFPNGASGGFWVHCDHGLITVGSGSLPERLAPADFQNLGEYIPVVQVGRTVNAALTQEEKEEQVAYSRTAFRVDIKGGEKPYIEQKTSDKQMPAELGRVMMVLHDELSMRTSGELPVDYEVDIREQWQTQPRFDRHPDYDPSWLKYDEFDIYGNPL